MTVEKIARLEELRQQEYHLKAVYKQAQAAVDSEEIEIQNSCDHVYPDGTSAVEGGIFWCTCKICHMSDL